MNEIMNNIGFPFGFEDTYGHGKRLKFIIKAIEDYCQERKKEKEDIIILDIGCGTGIGVTFPLASLGYFIVGVDIDRDSVHYAKVKNIYPNASFKNGSLDKIPHLSGFDVIICSEVLEHVPNPKEFLLLLTSRLKKGGIIILTVPNGYSWFEFEKFIYERVGLKYFLDVLVKLRIIPAPKNPLPLITLNKKDKHLQRFSYRKIKNLLREVGLEIDRESGVGIFGGPISETLFWWFKPLLKFNNWLGDKSPRSLIIDWHFVLKNKN